MIMLDKITQQDFLNREWVKRLLDAGVDMSDAKYYLADDPGHLITEIFPRDIIEVEAFKKVWVDVVPTYTVSELYYKLHEYIYLTIDGEEFSGGLHSLKDAPFYLAYYHLENKDKTKWNEDLFACFEFPIYSFAGLLIQCHRHGVGDAGDIRSKWK